MMSSYELMRLYYATRYSNARAGTRVRQEIKKRVLSYYGGTQENTAYTEGCRWFWFQHVLKHMGKDDAVVKMKQIVDLEHRENILLDYLFGQQQEKSHYKAKTGKFVNTLDRNAPVIKRLGF